MIMIKKMMSHSSGGILWDYPKEHNHNAQWIQNTQKELGWNAMEDIVITEEMVKKQAKKMKNWAAPGKDEVRGFWISI